MDALWLATSGVAALLGSLGSGYWASKRARAALEPKIAELEGALGRERSASRRRADEDRRALERANERARALVGLAPGEAPVLRGAALARALVDRVAGLAAIESVSVVDREGLAWASSPAAPALDAVAGAALRLEEVLESPLREIRLETMDVRHLVVRPLIATLPRLALATVTSSRRTPAFLLDAVVAFAAEACGAADISSSSAASSALARTADTVALAGSLASDVDSAVAREVARELEAARASSGLAGLAVTMGDAILASSGDALPTRDSCLRLTRGASLLAAAAEQRIGAVRRIDLAGPGSTVAICRLGRSGKLTLLAFDAGAEVGDAVIDRLVGRLRRFVPPQPTIEMKAVGLA
ncbi:MAG: hypothetical protein JNL21_21890 [Myxococcales bacterium]|nr:hypothetical protein [Myxococcales bacterium]